MAVPQETDHRPSIEPPQALGLPQRPRALPHVLVRAHGAAIRAQHARLEHPDRVGEQRDQGPGDPGGHEVVCGREGIAGSARGGLQRRVRRAPAVEVHELALDGGFEVEEDGPAAGVADEVRGQAAVQALDGLLVREEGSQDNERADGGGGGAAVDWEMLVLLLQDGRWENRLWRRVLITSSGWTASVDTVPAERPAMVSTSAGERRAWFSFIREAEMLVFSLRGRGAWEGKKQ